MQRTPDEDIVCALSDEYETALVRNDVAAIDGAFWASPLVLRFGIADMQFGWDDVVAWRAQATPVSPSRRIVRKVVLELAPGVVAVDITYRNGDDAELGRQSQTWVQQLDGWRIVRAHVSRIAGG